MSPNCRSSTTSISAVSRGSPYTLAATDPVTQYGRPICSSGSRNGASVVRAGMVERTARLELQPLLRPVRVRHPPARDAKLYARLVQVAHHVELPCRRHALESLNLHGMERFGHGGG